MVASLSGDPIDDPKPDGKPLVNGHCCDGTDHSKDGISAGPGNRPKIRHRRTIDRSAFRGVNSIEHYAADSTGQVRHKELADEKRVDDDRSGGGFFGIGGGKCPGGAGLRSR